jgi:hypothetical protein
MVICGDLVANNLYSNPQQQISCVKGDVLSHFRYMQEMAETVVAFFVSISKCLGERGYFAGRLRKAVR